MEGRLKFALRQERKSRLHPKNSGVESAGLFPELSPKNFRNINGEGLFNIAEGLELFPDILPVFKRMGSKTAIPSMPFDAYRDAA